MGGRQRATFRLRQALGPHVNAVHLLHLPDGADPDDLIDTDLAALVGPFFSS